MISRNVALVADAPKLRSIPKVEQKAWTAPDEPARNVPNHRNGEAPWLTRSGCGTGSPSWLRRGLRQPGDLADQLLLFMDGAWVAARMNTTGRGTTSEARLAAWPDRNSLSSSLIRELRVTPIVRISSWPQAGLQGERPNCP